jgi:hypothetical protein
VPDRVDVDIETGEAVAATERRCGGQPPEIILHPGDAEKARAAKNRWATAGTEEAMELIR